MVIRSARVVAAGWVAPAGSSTNHCANRLWPARRGSLGIDSATEARPLPGGPTVVAAATTSGEVRSQQPGMPIGDSSRGSENWFQLVLDAPSIRNAGAPERTLERLTEKGWPRLGTNVQPMRGSRPSELAQPVPSVVMPSGAPEKSRTAGAPCDAKPGATKSGKSSPSVSATLSTNHNMPSEPPDMVNMMAPLRPAKR